MATCINKLTANISYDCSGANTPVAGLESRAVIINRADLDRTAITTSGASVTNLSLNAGTQGFSIDWIKQLGSTGAEAVINESGLNKFGNSFACRVFGQTAQDAERIQELLRGEFVVVVESRFKGQDNTSAFKIFGLENGLHMSEGSFTSLENDGGFLFTLASQAGYEESFPYRLYLETSYTATKVKFDALFAE